MIPLSDIKWGPTDAAKFDDHFLDKFIEPVQIKQLISPKYWIIAGEKGSGKTALCKGITLKYGSSYACKKMMRFNDMEFCAIIKNLKELTSATDVSALTLISHYWEYVLIIKAIQKYFKKTNFHLSPKGSIVHNYLIKKGLLESTALSIMLNLVGTGWTFIDKWTKPKGQRPSEIILPSNLSSEIVDTISKYPIFDPEFIKIRKLFSDHICSKKERILLTLDGFDRLKSSEECNRESLQIIFEGLIEAVYAISISEDLSMNLQIKAFIPYDRYVSLDLRDSDKIESTYKRINWDYGSQKQFLSKRLALNKKIQHLTKFDDQWQEVLPQKIWNNFYKIDETTYDYILRHTMYRPRHLQVHLEMLADKYYDETIDPSMIPKSIRESSKKLARFIVKEYKIDHPLMDHFLRRFKGCPNIIPFYEFREIVTKALEIFEVKHWTVNKKIDSLYNMGFCGVVKHLDSHHGKIDRIQRYMPPRKTGVTPYQCDFYYVKPEEGFSSTVVDQSLIAIHSIFFDYCDLVPHENMLVG